MKHIIIAISILLAFTINAQVDHHNTSTNGTYASAIGLNNDADGANVFVGWINRSKMCQKTTI